MAEQSGEKSFEATQHRRQEAREKGQVAYSQDLGSAILLVVGTLLVMSLGGAIVDFSAKLMVRQLGELPDLAPTQGTMLQLGWGIAAGAAGVLLPMLGLMMLSGVLTSVLQVGFLFVPDRIAPDLSRLDPLKGLGRIFSVTGTMRLGFGLIKVLVISIVTGLVLWLRGTTCSAQPRSTSGNWAAF